MPVRLSELLDRIRPAGAPGAATDTEPQRDRAAAFETAALVDLLGEIEAEADDVVASAARRADDVRADAADRAQRLRSEQSERVAVASVAVAEATERDVAAATTSIAARADAEIERLRAGADLDRLAAEIVDLVWRPVEEATP